MDWKVSQCCHPVINRLFCVNFSFLCSLTGPRFRWSLTATMLCMIMPQGTWQKEGEEPLPSANEMIELPRYFKTDTDSDMILILSTFLGHASPCAVDVTIVNSEYADEIAVYWNRTAILLKVNATKKVTVSYSGLS